MIARDLVIIEAPGKIRTLSRIFQGIGLHADVHATLGHFLEYPRSLAVAAIQRRGNTLVEAIREPHRQEVFDSLQRVLSACRGRVLIATDDDPEGQAIAHDVATLAEKMGLRQPVFRLRLAGLDEQSVVRGLNSLTSVRIEHAVPAIARRMTDRLIGSFYTDFERSLPVGRVQTALLSLANEGSVVRGEVAVRLQASDGASPFVGIVPVTGTKTPAQLLAELELDALPPVPVAQRSAEPLAPPMQYADALLRLNGALGLEIDAAAALLQEMYESGEISYPRTANRGFTEAGADVVSQLARVKGLVNFKRDTLPRLTDEVGAGHEAIRLLRTELAAKVDVTTPPKLQRSVHDAALSIVARSTLEAGVAVQREHADTSALPSWAHEVTWTRDVRRVALPWRTADRPEVRTFGAQAGLVATMTANGIGRPSTWPTHSSKFLERGFVDDDFRLTDRGALVLSHAPSALREVVTSREIEAMLERGSEDVAALVREALVAVEGGNHAAVDALIENLQQHADDADEYENRFRPRF